MNKIKIIGFLALVGTVIILTGCRIYNKVYSDYDRTTDFSQYRTFAWLPDRDTSNTTFNNQIIRNNTLNYFTHCMGERGLQAELDSPDVLLQLVVHSLPKQLTITSSVYQGSPAGGRYNPYYYPHPNNFYYHSPFFYSNTRYVTERYNYAESTITLNVYDRRLNRLVWTGTAKGDLYDPAFMADNLHPAVFRILKNFPIKPLQKERRREHTAIIFSQDSLKPWDGASHAKTGNMKTIKRSAIIKSKPEEVFAFMDDIGNTGMHMTKSNAPMMGSKLTVEWLTEFKTGLGSKYRWKGKTMGIKMDFTVEVTKWVQGKEKIWETLGDAKMIVLDWYRMHLVLTPLNDGTTQAELGIYYTKPKGSILGFLLARRYAVWCVKSMLNDSKKHFKNIHPDKSKTT